MIVRAFRNKWPHTVGNCRKCVVEVRLYLRRTLVLTFYLSPGQFMSLPATVFALEGAEVVPTAIIK